MRLSRSHFPNAAASTKPAMKIQMMGSVNEVSAVFQASMPVMENTRGGSSAAIPRGTHSSIHHVSTHRSVPRATWGALSKTSIAAAASAMDCGVGHRAMTRNNVGPTMRPMRRLSNRFRAVLTLV